MNIKLSLIIFSAGITLYFIMFVWLFDSTEIAILGMITIFLVLVWTVESVSLSIIQKYYFSELEETTKKLEENLKKIAEKLEETFN